MLELGAGRSSALRGERNGRNMILKEDLDVFKELRECRAELRVVEFVDVKRVRPLSSRLVVGTVRGGDKQNTPLGENTGRFPDQVRPAFQVLNHLERDHEVDREVGDGQRPCSRLGRTAPPDRSPVRAGSLRLPSPPPERSMLRPRVVPDRSPFRSRHPEPLLPAARVSAKAYRAMCSLRRSLSPAVGTRRSPVGSMAESSPVSPNGTAARLPS